MRLEASQLEGVARRMTVRLVGQVSAHTIHREGRPGSPGSSCPALQCSGDALGVGNERQTLLGWKETSRPRNECTHVRVVWHSQLRAPWVGHMLFDQEVPNHAPLLQVETDYCLLLALPCGRDQEDVVSQTESLKAAFITYLQAKQAAGIINVPNPGSNQVGRLSHPCPTFVHTGRTSLGQGRRAGLPGDVDIFNTSQSTPGVPRGGRSTDNMGGNHQLPSLERGAWEQLDKVLTLNCRGQWHGALA